MTEQLSAPLWSARFTRRYGYDPYVARRVARYLSARISELFHERAWREVSQPMEGAQKKSSEKMFRSVAIKYRFSRTQLLRPHSDIHRPVASRRVESVSSSHSGSKRKQILDFKFNYFLFHRKNDYMSHTFLFRFRKQTITGPYLQGRTGKIWRGVLIPQMAQVLEWAVEGGTFSHFFRTAIWPVRMMAWGARTPDSPALLIWTLSKLKLLLVFYLKIQCSLFNISSDLVEI